MKKKVKILAGIMVVGGALFLSGCNKQKYQPTNSLTIFGTYTGSGNVTTPEGAKATVTSTSVTLTCPPGLYVPIALANNIPSFNSQTIITYNGTTLLSGYEVGIDPAQTPPGDFSGSLYLINGGTLIIGNQSGLVGLACVPLSAIDSFSL
ncbi:hypothetical protein [Francisella hispaniensis]|uniref:Lipoprotein n=1 Tax=Francisella hispaniensis TaxID=622488 RepID=F4BJE1_9GAMM|nr:hypothetical protein [Francisella hispaniensis]AEB28285.1 hypothetical protein FN3523_0428 [Francisella hispaniensis]